jgi:hypothetical protein
LRQIADVPAPRLGDELTKIWNSLDSSIRLQCITNLSVDSYTGLKQCIEHMAKRGR